LTGVSYVFAVTYLPQMFSGLWLDEAGSHWMAQGGLRAAVTRTATWPGQSLLYSALQSAFLWGTGSWMEFVMRVPALLGALLCVAAVAALARNLGLRGLSIGVTLVTFLTTPAITKHLVQARPYSLALAFSLWSIVALHRWINSARLRYLMLAAGFLALTIYFHYLYAAVCLLHLWLLVIFNLGKPSPFIASLKRYLLALLGVAVAVSPLSWHALSVATSSDYDYRPNAVYFEHLRNFLMQEETSFYFVIVGLSAMLFGTRPLRSRRAEVLFLAGLWLGIPVLMFVLAKFAGKEFFIPRYLLLATVAIPCLGGLLLHSAAKARGWLLAFLLVIALNPVNPFKLSASSSVLADIEYRSVVDLVERYRSTANVPLIFQSPLVESNSIWQEDQDCLRSRLCAPLLAYRAARNVILVPRRFEPRLERFLLQKEQQGQLTSKFLLIVSERAGGQDFVQWFSRRGYRVSRIGGNRNAVFEIHRDSN
jgi:hypothetical protein